MSYYRVCPLCGAALDPGERCDCQDKEEAAPVLQHQNGRVEKVLTAKFPPPILHEKKKNARRFA